MPNVGPNNCPATLALLRLTLTPGLGPRLIARLIADAGSPAAALELSPAGLRSIKGIGPDRARTIHEGLAASADLALRELDLADKHAVHLVTAADPAYPALLAELPDAPPLLYVQGSLDPAPPGGADRFAIGIVGSRSCTPYGLEQTARFATAFAQAGLTVVSGGARGIDTAAHSATLRTGSLSRTIAVLGCGLAHRYPPENAPLFDAMVAQAGARGALVSELPLATPPTAENFPARNRLIAGMTLGILVVEAGRRSGALITARDAAEQGREVFALPGRVDSPASEGSLELLKAGGAQLVTHPEDVIQALESQARHHHHGTHASRFASTSSASDSDAEPSDPLFTIPPPAPPEPAPLGLTSAQASILAALDAPRSVEDLARTLGLDSGQLRAELTVLEVRRRVKRRGALLERS